MASIRLRSTIAVCMVVCSMFILGSAWAASPGDTLWARRFTPDTDAGLALAASPDGTTVFVTGYSGGSAETLAYDAVTGAKLWSASYDGPDGFGAGFNAIAVSPGGDEVFVAGYTYGATSGADYATAAYDASSGSLLWDRTYAGPQSADVFDDFIQDIAVTPSGIVVVTGRTAAVTALDYATIAYEGTTGRKLWTRRYDGPAGTDDIAFGVAASPDGSSVFVTGRSDALSPDYATIAYDASTGTKMWRKRYDGPGHSGDIAYDVAVAPDSSTVFVTGGSSGETNSDFGTIAYDASTGTQLWVKFYDDKVNGGDSAYSVGTSPDGKAVYVTGGTEEGFATVAYDAATSARLWAREGVVGGTSQGLVVSPDGTKVVVVGGDSPLPADRDYLTISYNAATGAKLWSRRYDGPADYQDNATAIAVAPDSSAVFVTGQSRGLSGDDMATVAYSL
jgi:outer membrane protein assembly factor BamB